MKPRAWAGMLCETARCRHISRLSTTLSWGLLLWAVVMLQFPGTALAGEAKSVPPIRMLVVETLAAAQDALVFAPHLPFPGVGRVRRQGAAWRWEPASSQT